MTTTFLVYLLYYLYLRQKQLLTSQFLAFTLCTLVRVVVYTCNLAGTCIQSQAIPGYVLLATLNAEALKKHQAHSHGCTIFKKLDFYSHSLAYPSSLEVGD